MRITTFNPSHLPAGQLHRVRDLLVDPIASLSPQYPQQKSSARPLAERLVEGEILPRPMAAETLLATYQANPAAHVSPLHLSTTENPPQRTSTSQVLFYQLHSSNESLFGDNTGKFINQHV